MYVVLALFWLACVAVQAQVKVTQILDAKTTPLSNPKDIETGYTGVLYVTDTGHDRLLALDSSGTILYENSEGASSSGLRRPSDLAVSPGGDLLVADAGNRRIMEYTRLLEWKGEFRIEGSDGSAAEPRELCQITSGDLLVFESDEGQFLRFDSFYSLSGRLGQRSGTDYSSAVSSLCFSMVYGVVWIDNVNGKAFRSDPLLTSVHELRVVPNAGFLNQLAAADSVLFLSDDETLWRVSPTISDSLTFLSLAIQGSRLRDLVIAAKDPNRLYLMDRRNGTLYHLYWP